MSEAVVRCPYCVQGSEFRPMFRPPGKKRFVCVICGHTSMPDGAYSNCHCPKCQQMNRIANRCRNSQELRQRVAPDPPLPAIYQSS